MSLSTKLQARVNARRQQREATRKRHRNLHNIGAALGLTAGIAAFVYGAQHPTYTLPPVPTTPVETPASEPATPPAVNINDVKPGTRCNPYVNGVYIGDLCRDHDSFAERAERISSSEETEAERVRGQALSYAAEKMLERCDRDWLPSTCAKMRAELGAN
jgi:hypothetical protein